MKRVVVLGGGFAGLAVCRGLRSFPGEVLLVDRQNHHLFQPLLYQVATAGLAGSDIAQPLRSLFKRQSNVAVRMGTVDGIDLAKRAVQLREDPAPLTYDYLVIALGVVTNWFSRPDWALHALSLKTLVDAGAVRGRILGAFERAECTRDPAERARLLTTCIIGGGPTGVEVAGALKELARFALQGEFRSIQPSEARVLLVESSPRILEAFTPSLADKARRALEAIGVEVCLNSRVTDMGPGWVQLGEKRIEAQTVLWTAGVKAPAVTRSMGVEVDRGGRIRVLPDCSIPGHPEAFATGDIAALVDGRGVPVPGLAPAAMQGGKHVARLILDEGGGEARPTATRPAFVYQNRGIMATIGRSRAVFQAGKVEMNGFAAWVGWLFLHLLMLIDLRSKLAVLLQWAFAYLRYQPGARIIYRQDDLDEKLTDAKRGADTVTGLVQSPS